MKKLHSLFLQLILVTFLISCTKQEFYILNDQVEQEDKSSYTIMMYGCGGGNLDKEMILNIQEALLTGTSKRVKFTGQVKFSARFQERDEFKGTQRFIVGPSNGTWYEPVEVLDEEMELYDPKNITDFIKWSKQQCPSDEYILLLWNHGSAWMPYFDAPNTRAIIHDDNNYGRAITLDELVKGIKDSGTKMKMIYYDACLMGMFEVLTGIRDCAEYALCASHVTPGIGGDYNSLIYHLNNSTNFENAISEYSQEVIAHWDHQKLPLDLKLVNLGNMDKLLSEVKVLSGYLNDVAEITLEYTNSINNGAQIHPLDNSALIAQAFKDAINSCYCYVWTYNNGVPSYPFYDLHMLAECLTYSMTHSYSARFVDISSRINRSLKETIVSKHQTSISQGWDFSMGVTVVGKDTWVEKGYNTTYNGLDFDKLTNWGKWLSINPINPTGNPDPKTIVGTINDDDEMPEITLEEEIIQMLKLIGK